MAPGLGCTYAAIRPGFGAGPKTAIVAGLMMGFTASLMAAYFVGMGFFTWEVWAPASALSTLNICLAALAGCALYNE